jgi:hypothetical protein
MVLVKARNFRTRAIGYIASLVILGEFSIRENIRKTAVQLTFLIYLWREIFLGDLICAFLY